MVSILFPDFTDDVVFLEQVEKLKADRDAKRKELDDLSGKTPKDLWKKDLADFITALDVWEVCFLL